MSWLGEQFTSQQDDAARAAAAAERQQWQDFFQAATPQMEADARRRHAAEAQVAARLEREQRDYEASLDAELDGEEALLAQQDLEDEEERNETDPRKLLARRDKREEERKEIERLIGEKKWARIPN